MDSPRRFRKKPVEVTAIQWTGSNWDAIHMFAGKHVIIYRSGDVDVWIEKSKTWRQGLPVGDWIIGELDGVGVYPCDAEAFARTHEALE